MNLLYVFLQDPSDVIALPGNNVTLKCVIIDDQSNLLEMHSGTEML